MDYYFISGTPGPMALDDFEKIVGGVEATPHQFPWQVGLFFDGYFCGGSIICKFIFLMRVPPKCGTKEPPGGIIWN